MHVEELLAFHYSGFSLMLGRSEATNKTANPDCSPEQPKHVHRIYYGIVRIIDESPDIIFNA